MLHKALITLCFLLISCNSTAFANQQDKNQDILLVSGEVYPFGFANIHTLGTGNGHAQKNKKGKYTLILKQKNKTVIAKHAFKPEYLRNKNIIAQLLSGAFFIIETPYPLNTYEVALKSPWGLTLARFDPVTRAIQDAFLDLPPKCINENSIFSKEELIRKTKKLKTFQNKNRSEETTKIIDELKKIVVNDLIPGCPLPGTEYQTIKKFKSVTLNRLSRFKLREQLDQ